MSPTDDAHRNSAATKAISSIDENVWLPDNVFIKPWGDYLFFDPCSMFGESFIRVKNSLLMAEGSSVIALVDLGDIVGMRLDSVFLHRETGWLDYRSKLVGDGSPMNWMFLMNRYVCASDAGGWSIYCEKENDVAVFACGEGLSDSVRSEISSVLMAKSIRSFSDCQKDQLFDFGGLVPSWRNALVSEYEVNK